MQSNPPAGASLSMQASSLRYFVALLLSTPPGYTKKQPQPRLFLYTGESVRFNKNAHCFAVEPSGWRFTFDASIFVTLFRRFAPSDSPRVHQKTTATAVVFVIRGSPCVLIKRTLLCSRTLPAIRNVPKAHIAPQVHRFCQRQKHRIIASVLTPRKNHPKYGRFFVVWIYCFLLIIALLDLLFFVEQCLVDIIAFC